MQYLNDIGFVIKRVNLGEADRFVTLFTKNNGKIEVLAKGVRKISSKRASHIELLNLINFNSVKTSRKYPSEKAPYILTEVDLVTSFEDRRETLLQCQTLFLICELVEALCPYGQRNTEVYSHIGRFIKKGDFSTEAINSWQTNILSILGYWDDDKIFTSEKESRGFIEQLIERKIRSQSFTI